jgi:hypothetical protein
MGCCVFAVIIVGQALEVLRRLKVFLGFRADLYPEAGATAPVMAHGERLKQLLRKPAVRVAVMLLLVSEASVAGTWLFSEHRDHVQEAMAIVKQWFVGGELIAPICSANTVAGAIRPASGR